MNPDKTPDSSQGPILAFYRGEKPDGAGRMLSQILTWNDAALEDYHDYIQWLFPLTEESRAVPGSPVLQPGEIKEFHSDPALQSRLEDAFKRMLNFYSFTYSENGSEVKITRKVGWSSQKPRWLQKGNHNYLRITRILKSLTILGLPVHAKAFLQILIEVYQSYKNDIGYDTYKHWTGAIETAHASN